MSRPNKSLLLYKSCISLVPENDFQPDDISVKLEVDQCIFQSKHPLSQNSCQSKMNRPSRKTASLAIWSQFFGAGTKL